ncbi:hypothetical protein pb186bvf_004586 [Paramecium bursaria]
MIENYFSTQLKIYEDLKKIIINFVEYGICLNRKIQIYFLSIKIPILKDYFIREILQYQIKMQDPLIAKTAQQRAGFFSKLFFYWVIETLSKAQKEGLSEKTIQDVAEEDKSQTIHKKFQGYYYGLNDSPHRLAKAILKTFQVEMFWLILTLCVQIASQLAIPLLIKYIILYIGKDEKTVQEAIWLVSGVFVCRLTYSITGAHTWNFINQIGLGTVAAVGLEILNKSMKISFLSNKNHSIGEVLTLLQVDASKLQGSTLYLAAVGLLPIQLGIAVFMMFKFIGISFLGGLGIIFLTIFCNMIIGKTILKYTIQSMKAKDARTKCASDIFQQIKFIKINALENYFIDKISQLRAQEVQTIKSRLIAQSLNVLSVWLSPSLILNSTFVIFIALGNDLTPQNTFALVSLFQILQVPLLALPVSINALLETNVSLKRLQNFFAAAEMQTEFIIEDNKYAVQIINGNLTWGKDKDEKQRDPNQSLATVSDSLIMSNPNCLKNINITIERGSFVAIVGDVGSGKSSLIQSILGEMIYDESSQKPHIGIGGSIAYVSQTAWIQNATVRDNVIFGSEFNQQKYDEAIKYSCLKDDLKILNKGDSTMIGEKGVNLSGGQKARIALARAIYSDKDIYLLDDPISAVDIHVGKFIMNQCLNGFLKNKTRVLVTHAVNFTQYCDYIYLMDKGEIIEEGKFNDLKQSLRFEQIYKKFFKQQDEEETQEVIEELKQPELKKQNTSVQVTQPLEKDEVDNLMLLEEKAQGSITVKTYFQYISWFGVFFFIIVIIFMLIWCACYLGSALWLAHWTEQSDDPDINNFFYLEIFLAFGLGQGIIAFVRTILMLVRGVVTANYIHQRMLNQLIYAPICQFFERVPIGQILNRLTKDQNTLDCDLVAIMSWVFIVVAQLLCNTILNIYSSTYYIIIPIFIYFIIGYQIQKFYMSGSRELFRLEAMSRSPIISFFSEVVSGLPTIRAFGMNQYCMDEHAQNLDINRKIALEQIGATVWFSLYLGLSSFIVNITAIIFCISGSNPGLAGVLLTYASSLDQNVQQAVQSTSMVENMMVSFERALAYTRVKPEKAYEQLVESYQQQRQHQEYKIVQWPDKGQIRYNNYSVKYREGLPFALNDVNLTIESKQKIGVVGRTGAGKSTITLTLLRILEASQGNIQIDGVDISTISLQQIRESITMIMQDATIFTGSIRDNIDPLKTRGDQEILKIMEDCCLASFVEKRNGLDGPIDANNMSVGEKQLLCIARAVLRQNKIVLIDEATANIDIETETIIQETIKKAFKECTVITIAHRINTILHSDKILVVDKGRVAEFGQTQDLLGNKDSLFYQIYQETQRQH